MTRIPDLADLARGYDAYYGSGFYQSRYPQPNPSVLRRVTGMIQTGSKRVLDFGCGDGRYAVPLLERTSATIIAYDISPIGIDILKKRAPLALAEGRLIPVAGAFDALLSVLDAGPPLDDAFLLFGVITHIRPRQTRIETLAAIRRRMKPGGRLVLSAGNRARRFKEEQAAARPQVAAGRLEPGDIVYQRQQDGKTIELYLHLYERREFVEDLEAAGFHLRYLGAESIMPETAVVKSAILAMIDATLRRMMPLDFAFDYLAVCENQG